MTSRNIKFAINVSVVLILISIFTVIAEPKSFRNKLTNPCNKFKSENRNECMQQRSRNYTIKLFKHLMKKRAASSHQSTNNDIKSSVTSRIKRSSQYVYRNIQKTNNTRCPENYNEVDSNSNPCVFEQNGRLKAVNITKNVSFFLKTRHTSSCLGDLSALEKDLEEVNVGMTCIMKLTSE